VNENTVIGPCNFKKGVSSELVHLCPGKIKHSEINCIQLKKEEERNEERSN
jgi:hypothetical protein